MKNNIYIITAGGTEEPIDSVRKITNMSTGKLGAKIANKLVKNISEYDTIIYVCHKNSIKPRKNNKIIIEECTDTSSVQEKITELSSIYKDNVKLFIHSMAISDYTVEGAYIDVGDYNGMVLESIDTSSKMDSSKTEVYIRLVKIPKILDDLKEQFPEAKLISFKLKNNINKEDLLDIASKQLKRTHSDYVIANDLVDIKAGNHIAYAISRHISPIELKGKKAITEFFLSLL
jgi:phosphopantothenate-cysteine ligase